MKKKILVLLFSLMFGAFATGKYTISCNKCSEAYSKTRVGCTKCYAWRMHGLESDNGKYAGYMVYHCQHGHTILVPRKDTK